MVNTFIKVHYLKCIIYIFFFLIDVEKPKFQNCPSNTISIDKLKSANIPVITASDNSGRVKSLTVDPVWFAPNVALSKSINVTYTAEDSAGNFEKCSFTIRVKGIYAHYFFYHRIRFFSFFNR